MTSPRHPYVTTLYGKITILAQKDWNLEELFCHFVTISTFFQKPNAPLWGEKLFVISIKSPSFGHKLGCNSEKGSIKSSKSSQYKRKEVENVLIFIFLNREAHSAPCKQGLRPSSLFCLILHFPEEKLLLQYRRNKSIKPHK